MKIKEMSLEGINNLVNWCRQHDWGINASYDSELGCIKGIEHREYNYKLDQMIVEYVSFTDKHSLFIWAGY